MKSFEQMYSEFYGAEIDDAAQIQLYSHSGTELKEFVNYCIEQAGINTVLCTVASSAVGQNGSVGCLHKRWYEFDDCVVCLDCGLKKD